MPELVDVTKSEGLAVSVPRWDAAALEVVCGIANAGGGYLLIPASQRDYLSGGRRTKRSFEAIANTVLEELGMQCPVTPVMDGGEFFLELEIPPVAEPLALSGAYWLYADGANTRQTYEAISRTWQDDALTPWELKALPYVERDDLSGEAVSALARIPLENADGGETFTEATERRLQRLGLVHPRTKKLVNAGALLLCTNPARFIPGATVHLAFFQSDGEPAGIEDEVVGPLARQMDEAVRLITTKYLPAVSTSKAFVRNCPPEAAIREAIANALLHKDYSGGVPVRVTVSPHQIVVQNAGSIPQGWTEKDLVESHVPHLRNPVIMTTARMLGMASAWGEGIGRMRMSCIEAGAEEPRFELSANRTAVTFALPVTKRGAAALRTPAAAGEPASKAKGSAVKAGWSSQRPTFAERSIAAAHKLDLTQTDEYVLQVLTTNGRATAQRIAQVLGVSERTVRRSFKKLRDYGFIERIGSDKAGYWNVSA